MKMRVLGLCAVLASAVGSTAVHAQSTLQILPPETSYSLTAVNEGVDSISYARETFLEINIETVADVQYYGMDSSTAALNIYGNADVSALDGHQYTVRFDLEGMVFDEALTNTSLRTDGGGNSLEEDFILFVGGGVGDNIVLFQKKTGSDTSIDTSDPLVLTARFAVSEDGGSITRTVINSTLEGVVPNTGTRMLSAEGIIMVESALQETVMPMDLTATAASGFTEFANGMNVAHIGGMMLSAKEGIYDSRNGGLVSAGVTADTLLDITVDSTTNRPLSTVQVTGDFSFAQSVTLNESPGCEPNNASGAIVELDEAMMTATMPAANLWMADVFLCIQAMADTPIPETRYMMMGDYGRVAGGAFDPVSMGHELGMIMRDGTTVHIPYMTTYEGYNQRVVLSNRSTMDAPYVMTFRPEAGVTATATDMAMGTLAAGSTMTYKVTDLVMLEKADGTPATRTAATIVFEASRTNIDVASVIVNKESRDTDTVVHHSE